MRRRFYPSGRLPIAVAKRNSHFVMVDGKYHLFNRISKGHIRDETMDDRIIERLPRIIVRKYEEAVEEMKGKLSTFPDIYVVVDEPPKCLSDIMIIVKQLHAQNQADERKI